MFDIPMNTSGAINMGDMLGNANTLQQPTQAPLQQITTQTPTINKPEEKPMSQRNLGNKVPPVKGIKLKKKQPFDLADGGVPLQQLRICLDWDTGTMAVDLDTSVFMLGSDNKVIGDKWFVYYYQLVSPDGSVRHHGDNLDGRGDDDEIIDVGLPAVDQRVQKLVFVVTINEAVEQGIDFGVVSNGAVRVINRVTNAELARYPLEESYAGVISLIVGEVYRSGSGWKFNPLGEGVNKDLGDLCSIYGVNVED